MTSLCERVTTSTDGLRLAGKLTHFPADLKAECVVAICDTREQMALNLRPLQVVRGTLDTGDYSVRGLTHHIAIERKSLGDLLSCCGTERKRFEREVQRLLAYPCRALVVESTWQEIERGEWRSKVTAQSALGSLLGWVAMGMPVVMAGDHQRAGRVVSRLLFIAARRRYRELRALAGAIGSKEVAEVTTWQNSRIA